MTSFSKASSIRSGSAGPLEKNPVQCLGILETARQDGRSAQQAESGRNTSPTPHAAVAGPCPREVRPTMRDSAAVPTSAPFPWSQAVDHGFEQLPPARRSRFDAYLRRADMLAYRDRYGFAKPPQTWDVAAWIRENEFAADGCGIVMVRYGHMLHYNPFTAASQALLCYENLFSDDEQLRGLSMKNLMRLVKHLEDTRVERGNFVTWCYYFPYQDLRGAWNSCLSQCSIMDVLLKYHEITGESVYRELALRAFSALSVDVADGGLASIDEAGNHWLQEYPLSRHFPDVLNGLISSVLMILANRPLLGDVVRDEHIAAWLATIRCAIEQFTHQRHVDYARGRGRTPVEYYPQMIAQLEVLAQHDPNDVYREYADRWRWIYEDTWRRRRFLAPLLRVRRRFRRWRYGL